MDLERSAAGSESLVIEKQLALVPTPSTAGHVEPGGKLGGPPPKAKYYLVTDSV
jgi:hypothetical protein